MDEKDSKSKPKKPKKKICSKIKKEVKDDVIKPSILQKPSPNLVDNRIKLFSNNPLTVYKRNEEENTSSGEETEVRRNEEVVCNDDQEFSENFENRKDHNDEQCEIKDDCDIDKGLPEAEENHNQENKVLAKHCDISLPQSDIATKTKLVKPRRGNMRADRKSKLPLIDTQIGTGSSKAMRNLISKFDSAAIQKFELKERKKAEKKINNLLKQDQEAIHCLQADEIDEHHTESNLLLPSPNEKRSEGTADDTINQNEKHQLTIEHENISPNLSGDEANSLDSLSNMKETEENEQSIEVMSPICQTQSLCKNEEEILPDVLNKSDPIGGDNAKEKNAVENTEICDPIFYESNETKNDELEVQTNEEKFNFTNQQENSDDIQNVFEDKNEEKDNTHDEYICHFVSQAETGEELCDKTQSFKRGDYDSDYDYDENDDHDENEETKKYQCLSDNLNFMKSNGKNSENSENMQQPMKIQPTSDDMVNKINNITFYTVAQNKPDTIKSVIIS